MTEEPQVADEQGNPTGPPEQDKQVMVGLHPFGGVRLLADDVRLSPQEAFILAGQLQAHATIIIQMGYAQQAAEAEASKTLLDQIQRGGIKMPPGVR